MDAYIWTVEDHLAGKPAEVVDLYHRFVALVEACGPFTYAIAKTAITLKGTRRGFAGATLHHRWLSGYLDLQHQAEDPRIITSAPYTTRLYVHHYRLSAPGELDETFAALIAEAYAVGQGAHLTSQ